MTIKNEKEQMMVLNDLQRVQGWFYLLSHANDEVSPNGYWGSKMGYANFLGCNGDIHTPAMKDSLTAIGIDFSDFCKAIGATAEM
jgi:hypothetical protein